MKIYSWNVNGLRAVIKKGAFQKFIAEYQPDILCLQETKAKQGQAEVDFEEYEEIWNSAERAGYSGTAIFTKIKPISTSNFKINIKDDFGDLSTEGRVLVAEFKDFLIYGDDSEFLNDIGIIFNEKEPPIARPFIPHGLVHVADPK